MGVKIKSCLGDAEVGYFGDHMLVKEDVGGLDIPMNYRRILQPQVHIPR